MTKFKPAKSNHFFGRPSMIINLSCNSKLGSVNLNIKDTIKYLGVYLMSEVLKNYRIITIF